MTFTSQFNAKGDLIMEKLTNLAVKNNSINFFEEMRRATVDIIALVLNQKIYLTKDALKNFFFYDFSSN